MGSARRKRPSLATHRNQSRARFSAPRCGFSAEMPPLKCPKVPKQKRRQCAAALTAFASVCRFFFESQFQTPENGPIARFDGLGRYQGRSGKKAGLGRWRQRGRAASQAVAHAKSGPQTCAAGGWFARLVRGMRLASGAVRSFFKSKFKAPKTPPSHGFRDFAAIKAGARNRPCSALFFRPHPAPGPAFRGPERPLPARQWPRSGQRK